MDYVPSVVLSREQIREIANFTRNLLDIKSINFPVLKALDLLEQKFENNLFYVVEEDDYFENGVKSAIETEDYEHFCIKILESVYNYALNNDGEALGFICHEMCHFISFHFNLLI